MTPIQVSIIVPVYNVAAYIERCVKSVEAQEYTDGLECLLVDDCGQDSSIQIATQLIEEYQGPIIFRIVSHETNRGLSAARNTGIQAARGKYLYFLDADDSIHPDCISLMMSMVDKYPEVEMVQSGAYTQGTDPMPWLDMTNSRLSEYIQGIEKIKPIMLSRKSIPVTAWNRLIRKDFIICHHLFFYEGLIHEDELWTFLLSKHLTSLAILKKNVYLYEQRASGIMASSDMKKGQSLILIAHEMIDNIDQYCTRQTIAYIHRFIHLYSFDIYDEPQRLAFLDYSLQLTAKDYLFSRLIHLFWLYFAKKPIRRNRFLYSVLYHTIQ